jgi:fermentation-respiration switch protein FrsA (DUF1100 family)
MIIGVVPGTRIDIWGHIGGLVAGTLACWLIGPIWDVREEPITGAIHVIDRNPPIRKALLGLGLAGVLFLLAIWSIVY